MVDLARGLKGLVGAALVSASAGLTAAPWTAASAPGIVVVSDASASTTADLLQRIVGVRDLAARATGLQVGDAVEPVRVLAPTDATGMREVVGDAARRNPGLLLAASLPSPFGHHLAVRANTSRATSPEVLMHEYVHLLTRAHVGDAPAWLDEGVSEFWSTLEERNGQLRVGAPLRRYAVVLQRTTRWIPLKELVSVPRGRYDTVGNRVELFYAQSWALVHYLQMHAPAATMPFAPALPPDADLASLETALRAWIWGPMSPRDIEPRRSRQVNATPVVRPLTEAEGLTFRAGILAYGEHPDRAIALATKALALAPEDPTALEAIGIASFLSNEPLQARSWLGKAVTQPGAGYLAHYYYGVLMADQPDVATRHLRRALELRPNFAPAVDRLKKIFTLVF